MNEQVLVFPASLLDEYPLGFSSDINHYLDKIFERQNTLYLDRKVAEADPSYKQIIPYCLFQYENIDKLFVYQRTKKGGESRLHDNYSLGVGGHINPGDDKAGKDWYLSAMRREIAEEVKITGSFTNSIKGVIYDDSNEVGKVHFGVVHLFTLFDVVDMACKDVGLANGSFWSYNTIFENLDKFESWSQLVFKNLFLEDVSFP
jgi:predicted NUDIX family phosphoesterase